MIRIHFICRRNNQNAQIDDIKGVEICEPQPPSEDFAFYATELPSTFIYSGAAPEDGDTLTTILNLILMNHQCLLLLKQWALLF